MDTQSIMGPDGPSPLGGAQLVKITLRGMQWLARIECGQCHVSRIEQVHQRTKSQTAVEHAAKTTARALGWKIGAETAICGACRRRK